MTADGVHLGNIGSRKLMRSFVIIALLLVFAARCSSIRSLDYYAAHPKQTSLSFCAAGDSERHIIGRSFEQKILNALARGSERGVPKESGGNNLYVLYLCDSKTGLITFLGVLKDNGECWCTHHEGFPEKHLQPEYSFTYTIDRVVSLQKKDFDLIVSIIDLFKVCDDASMD